MEAAQAMVGFAVIGLMVALLVSFVRMLTIPKTLREIASHLAEIKAELRNRQ